LYRDNKYYVPDLYTEEEDYFNPKVNPAYEYCEVKRFLAYERGRVVGRIAAILNKKYNEKTGEKRMRFSRFDVEDNPKAAEMLLKAVENFAKEKGMEVVHGPIGFSDLDKQGMLIEGFDRLDTSMTIYNYPYYPKFLEACGYEKEVDWVEFLLKPSEATTKKLARIAAHVKKTYGVSVIKAKKVDDIKMYTDDIFGLINDAYSHLYGVTPLTKKMQEYYFNEYFKLINYDYVAVCVDKEGKLAGFGLAFPSIARALQKSRGKLLPLGFARLLYALRHSKVLELALIAVRKDFIGTGLNAVIVDHVYRNGLKRGLREAETGPQLETNTQIQNHWRKICTELEQHKRRRCYAKRLV
jgi:GNAT superfamily N-acetyltransferase